MAVVAVTGAGGFVGGHVLAALAGRDVEIVAQSRRDRVDPTGRVHWVTFDPATEADPFARLGRPDRVIHLAWGGLPNYRSRHHFETELPNQYAFLRRLVGAGGPVVTVTGTCFEYGMRSGPLDETMPTEPTNPYGYAKDALRRQLTYLADDIGFDLRWTRLFYLYGDGQAPTSLWTSFQAAVARGDARFDMSAGEQLRDFLPIGEAAAALVDVTLAPVAPRIVNVCSGVPRSVRGLVEGWRAALGSSIELGLGHYPYPTWEPMAFWGDAGRLRALRESRP